MNIFTADPARNGFLESILDYFSRMDSGKRMAFCRRIRNILTTPDAGGKSPGQINLLNNILEFLEADCFRLSVVVNHDCQQRCAYCPIIKEKKYMPPEVMHALLANVLTTCKEEIIFHFYGVEPLLSFGMLSEGVKELYARAAKSGKRAGIVISTNCAGLTAGSLSFFREYNVSLEIGFDGLPESHKKNRPSATGRKTNSYRRIKEFSSELNSLPSRPLAIMVVPPWDAEHLSDNFMHIVQLGFKRIQINFALGIPWRKSEMAVFGKSLDNLGTLLRSDASLSTDIELMNLKQHGSGGDGILLYSNEPSVDVDGNVYASNMFLNGGENCKKLLLGSLIQEGISPDVFMLRKLPRDLVGKTIMGERLFEIDKQMAGIMGGFAEKFGGMH